MIGGTPFCWACLEADSCHRVHPSSGTVDLVGHTSCFMCYLILSWHIAGSSGNLFLKLDTDSYIFSAEPVVLQWKVHTGKDTCTGTKEQKSQRKGFRMVHIPALDAAAVEISSKLLVLFPVLELGSPYGVRNRQRTLGLGLYVGNRRNQENYWYILTKNWNRNRFLREGLLLFPYPSGNLYTPLPTHTGTQIILQH
jgi:hypothetical protein